MIEIIVCDDDTYILESLSSIIQKIMIKNNLQYLLKSFESGETMIEYLKKAKQGLE